MRKNKIFLWLPTIGASLLALGVFVFIWGHSPVSSVSVGSLGEREKSVLVVGVDDAGENTDVLLLCTQNLDSGALKILQIPRDTLYRTGNGTGKINRIFRYNSLKYGRKKAAEMLSEEISGALGVAVDAYLLFDGKTVKEFVDLIGGVTVDVPFSFTYTDSETGESRTLAAGEKSLSGEEALAFVRHRASYAEGDLGRLDAQMRFLSGVCEGVPRLKKWNRLLAVYQKILPNLLTNLREKDIIELMMAYLKAGRSVSVSFLRLPGEAAYTNGVWYYVLHRAATEKMLATELGADIPFDDKARFVDPETEAVRNVYFYPVTDYRVHTPSDVKTGRIIPKKS